VGGSSTFESARVGQKVKVETVGRPKNPAITVVEIQRLYSTGMSKREIASRISYINQNGHHCKIGWGSVRRVLKMNTTLHPQGHCVSGRNDWSLRNGGQTGCS